MKNKQLLTIGLTVILTLGILTVTNDAFSQADKGKEKDKSGEQAKSSSSQSSSSSQQKQQGQGKESGQSQTGQSQQSTQGQQSKSDTSEQTKSKDNENVPEKAKEAQSGEEQVKAQKDIPPAAKQVIPDVAKENIPETEESEYEEKPFKVPPGLEKVWYEMDVMPVLAKKVTQGIILDDKRGIEVANIAIEQSTTNQVIKELRWSEDSVIVVFDRNGDVGLTLDSTEKPVSVYADDRAITEFNGSINTLNPKSLPQETWHYTGNVLLINTDPVSITVAYEPPQSSAINIDSNLLAMIGGVAVAASIVGAVAYKKKKNS